MTHNTIIRDYTATDKDALLQLLRLNTPQYFAPAEEQDFSDYLDKHREVYFVLEYNQEIVACGGLNFPAEKHIGVISWDMVHPACHGKGLGGLLLRHRIDYLSRDPQITMVRVRTTQHTYQFYEKFGFELKEVVKDYWAAGFDLYNMLLPLKKD